MPVGVKEDRYSLRLTRFWALTSAPASNKRVAILQYPFQQTDSSGPQPTCKGLRKRLVIEIQKEAHMITQFNISSCAQQKRYCVDLPIATSTTERSPSMLSKENQCKILF
jgi:hypothetical protein